MAAHVYWRLYITATNADNFAGLAEWTPKDSGGSTIATTGGTATASTAYPGQPASNAFDSNLSTFWLTNGAGAPHWLQYQFASAVDIASFTLTNPSGGNDPHCPMDFQLQYSDNGSTWTTLYTWLGAGFGTAGQQVTNTFNSANQAVTTLVIAWRLSITSSGGGTCRIAEWKLYNASSTQIATSTYSASATSSFDGHQAPYLALDGNAVTYWNTNGNPSVGTPQNLAYSFGTSAPVASFSIQADDYSRAPVAFALQYSTDGITWLTAGSYTAAAWTANGQIQTFGVPAISVAPTSAGQGAAVTLTVTGSNTHFVSGTTTVSFSGTGISVGTITVASATSLTAAITITTGAATGARTLTVTTGSEAPATAFTVNVGIFQRGNIDYDQIRSSVRQGTGGKFQMFEGSTVTAGNVAVYNANGNVVDSGSAPSGPQVNADWSATTGAALILNKPPITWDGTTIRENANTTVTAGNVLAVNSPDNSRFFSVYINDSNWHPVLHSSSNGVAVDFNTKFEVWGGDFYVWNAAFGANLKLSTPASGNPNITSSTTLLEMNNNISVKGGYTLTWFSPDGLQTGSFQMPQGDDFTITSTTDNIKTHGSLQVIVGGGHTGYIWLYFPTDQAQPTITATGGDGTLHFGTAATFDFSLTATGIGQKLVFAGPASGTGTATFRALQATDLPAGTGSVTSVGLSAPAEFTVTGSPVTTSGSLTLSKATQAANTVYAGPTTGAAAAPTFRTQVAADVPQIIKVNGVLRG